MEISSISVTLQCSGSTSVGFEYSLYALGKNGWEPYVQRVFANKDTIKVKVPSKALYYLQNVSLNTNGPVFVIEDGKQKML